MQQSTLSQTIFSDLLPSEQTLHLLRTIAHAMPTRAEMMAGSLQGWN